MKNIMFLIIVLTIFAISCSKIEEIELMSYDEYDQLSASIQIPYVLEINSDKGSLLYFGTEHTTDVNHPQFDLMDSLWNEFKPTIAFSEGGIWELEESREKAISKHGEHGFLRFLSERDSIAIHSIEPMADEEIEYLLERFSPEEVKLYYLLRQVVQYRRMKYIEPIEDYIEKYIFIFGDNERLQGVINSVNEFEEIYSKYIDEPDDWRTIPATWFNPLLDETIFNQIGRTSSRFRDEYIVKKLTEQVYKGSRVFAVVGLTHVVMQEPVLRYQMTK
jgi:hypothetical protein